MRDDIQRRGESTANTVVGFATRRAGFASLIVLVYGLACCSPGVLFAQDYREGIITFTDGRTDTWEVLAEAPGDMARRLVVRGGGEVDTVKNVADVTSLDLGEGGYFRQVARPFRLFGGGEDPGLRLARRIVEGPVSLYRLDLRTEEKKGINEIDAYGTWTYYIERDGELYELPQTESGEGGYRRRQDFIGRLNYHLRDCEALTARLKTDPPRYRDSELIEVLRLYGTCVGSSVEVARKPGKLVRFGGFVAGAGMFNLNRPVGLDQRLPLGSGRVAFHLGRGSNSPATFLETGIDYVITEQLDSEALTPPTLMFIPVIVRIETNRAKHTRPFVTAGLLFNPFRLTQVGFTYLSGGAGVYVGRARAQLRLTPVVSDNDNPMAFIVGLTAGYEFGGPGRPRPRVRE